MTEPDRGESYLEIQMDRSTIVLAALGILACMAVAFLLGSWTATRKLGADQAAAAALAAPLGAAGDTGAEASEVDVDAEPNFGGRPLSASGAAALTAVPQPATPARAGARPGGSSGITVASDDDGGGGAKPRVVAPADAPTPPRPAPARPAPARPTPTTKSPGTSGAPAAASGVASSTASSTGWVVQVAAVKERPEAVALQARLQGKGYPVRILEEAGFLKVQVGPYAEKSEAQSAEQRLKRERGLATWVKKA